MIKYNITHALFLQKLRRITNNVIDYSKLF